MRSEFFPYQNWRRHMKGKSHCRAGPLNSWQAHPGRRSPASVTRTQAGEVNAEHISI